MGYNDIISEIPAICARDSDHTRSGVIYYRTRDRRPESAPVSNAYDLRDILDRATVSMMARYSRLGLQVARSQENPFDQELEGL